MENGNEKRRKQTTREPKKQREIENKKVVPCFAFACASLPFLFSSMFFERCKCSASSCTVGCVFLETQLVVVASERPSCSSIYVIFSRRISHGTVHKQQAVGICLNLPNGVLCDNSSSMWVHMSAKCQQQMSANGCEWISMSVNDCRWIMHFYMRTVLEC